MSEQRIQYRTSDGIIHIWTQEEIDARIQAMNVPVIDMSAHAQRNVTLRVEQMGRAKPTLFEDDAVSMQEEALTTLGTLHTLLIRHSTPPTLGHETVQDLLSRIDVMAEPLKAMVQALEVKV